MILHRYDESDMDMSEDDQDELGKKAANTVHDLSVEKIKKVEKRTPEKKNKKRQNLVKKINIEGCCEWYCYIIHNKAEKNVLFKRSIISQF